MRAAMPPAYPAGARLPRAPPTAARNPHGTLPSGMRQTLQQPCSIEPGSLMATAQGFRQAMRLMRSHDPQRKEDGFHQLLPHAADHLDELIAQFEQEQDDHWPPGPPAGPPSRPDPKITTTNASDPRHSPPIRPHESSGLGPLM